MAPVFECIHKEVVSDTPSFEVGQSRTEVVAWSSSGSQTVAQGPTDGTFEFNDFKCDKCDVNTANCATAGFTWVFFSI